MKLLAVHMLRMQCPTPSFDSALAVRNAFSSCLTPIISSVLNSSNLWYFITTKRKKNSSDPKYQNRKMNYLRYVRYTRSNLFVFILSNSKFGFIRRFDSNLLVCFFFIDIGILAISFVLFLLSFSWWFRFMIRINFPIFLVR